MWEYGNSSHLTVSEMYACSKVTVVASHGTVYRRDTGVLLFSVIAFFE